MSSNEEELFGAGIELDRNWDIVVTGTGDVGFVSGLDELQKDLAFRVADRIRDEIGSRNRPSQREAIKAIVREELVDDPRVERIITISARETSPNEVELLVEVFANDEQQELVFEV